MQARRFIIGSVVASACLATQPARAAAIVACVIDEAPWGRKSDNSGIYPEVIDRLVRETGLEIQPEITPLPRVLHDVHSNHCQLTITSWTASRADRVVRGAVFAELDYGLLIGEPFDSDTRFEKYLVDGYEQAMTMTEAGRVDAAVGSMVTLEALAQLRNGTCQRL